MNGPVKYHLGKFPPKSLDLSRLFPLVGPANAALARYDGLLSAITDPSVLLSPLTTQEAVLSSKIEGTQVTMGEVLELEAGGDPDRFSQPKRDDVEEVINYRTALTFCAKSLVDRPLSQSLLREAHALLLQGVRGAERSPGQYRTDQNWIGAKGCPITEASFVPIAPEHLLAGLDHWTSFLNEPNPLDPLVQLALLHVEFEALHPFRDGNGRLGRMLIPLFLYQRKMLSGPTFYMSDYFEARREEYHEKLRAVSGADAWSGWVAFFLEGITSQAKGNAAKVRSILDLYERSKAYIVKLTHSQYAIKALDFIFRQPVFAAPHFIEHADIPKPTAMRILQMMRKDGMLAVLREGKGRRSWIYAFRELLNAAEGRRVI